MREYQISKSALEDCKMIFPNKKLYKVPIKIANNTEDDFLDVLIQHRTNDKEFSQPNVLYIPLLKKGQAIIIQGWPFGKDFPSKTSNVILSAIPFLSWVPATRGWGKDYWSIFCSTSKMNNVLETDSWAQRWYANVFESDIKSGVTITFNWNFERGLYWVSLYRLSNGQSTHYLDYKQNQNPYHTKYKAQMNK